MEDSHKLSHSDTQKKVLPVKPSHALIRIFELTENSQDSWRYFQFFTSQPKERFALVYPDSESVLESWDSLFHDLKVLWQLELFPVVVLNSGLPGYIKRFLKAGFQDSEGVNFPISFLRRPIHLKDRVVRIISEKKKIPVLLIQMETTKERDEILSSILQELHSNKLILLNEKAGIRKKDNSRISLINLSREKESFLEDEDISLPDKELIRSVQSIIDKNSNRRLTISITSATSLMKELFTVKGSGTLIKRGSFVNYSKELSAVDLDSVIKLVETSFRKKCNPFFIKSLKEDPWEILWEGEYKACALFRRTNWGVLLSKFAVDEIARGEGVGREIWDRMKELFPFLFWRGRVDNPISGWYKKEADGMIKKDRWIYFWMGESSDMDILSSIIRYMEKLPEDWVKGEL